MFTTRFGRRVLFVVFACLAVLITSILFFVNSVSAYDGRCPVESATIGHEGPNPLEHRFVELTIKDNIADQYVQGQRAYSDLPWFSDEDVRDWRVVPPTDSSINQEHHWRVVIETRNFFLHPFLVYLYNISPESIAYLRCSFPDPSPPPDQTPLQSSKLLAPAQILPSQGVCFESFTSVDWNGNPIYLTSQGNSLVPLAIDDILEITVDHPDGSTTGAITWSSMTRDFGPVKVSEYFSPGVNQVRTRILDVMEPTCGGSAVWLLWEGGISPPNEDFYFLLDNFAIREAQPSAQLRYPIVVPSWMRWIKATLRKGSNATISLVAPDGTVYGPNNPLVEYFDTHDYASIVLGFGEENPGTWEVVIDVISADPNSIFYLTVGGKQGELSSTDTIPPTSSIQLDGTLGLNGWYTSPVVVTLSAQDNPGGSGVQRIEWSSDEGLTWYEFLEPFTQGQEGIYHLLVRAIDVAGNVEYLPANAFLGIDWTPPETSGMITGSRDMLGIFRSAVTNELTATDNLSGVEATYISFDNGGTWGDYTDPFTLTDNGIYNFLFRSSDMAGNEEQPKESVTVEIRRFIALADSLLNVDEATTLQTQGVSHSNGNASITDSVTIAFDVLHYAGSFTQSGNNALTFGELAQVTELVPMPFYPLSFYRERCTYISGPLKIFDTSPVYNTCLYVGGNVELWTTGARGKLTIVSEGTILDNSTNATLEAWDATNGILFYARKGYTNKSTGANYTGVIYAPFSTIGGEFTNRTFNGGLFAKTVNLGGGTGLTAQQAPGFPASTYALPLVVPAPTTPTFLYLSATSNGTVGGVSYGDEDILKYNLEADSWSLFIDGSDIGLGNTDIDAFDLQPDGSMLISFDSSTFTIPGVGTVEDRDIVKFTPTSTGNTTSGTFSIYFDGSDVGLTTSGEDIDAIGFAPDGRLILSTEGSFSVNGVSGEDEDLIAFTPSQLGATTSGTWSMYFDGSDVGLSNSSNEDVNGSWVDVSTGKIYLSTIGSFSVTGLSGDGADIFICTPGSLGVNTTCTFGPGIFWDGSINGFSGKVIDGLDVIK